MSAELKDLRAVARAFAEKHVSALAAEILDWQDTGLLCAGYGGRLRELAALCAPFSGDHAMQVAESMAKRAALEFVVRSPAPGAPGQEAAALKPCRHGHIHCLACMNNRPKPQEAEEDRQIIATYEKLHEGKLGAHWMWCVIEQIAAGVPEAEAFKSFGYYEAGPSRKRFDAAKEAAAVQAVGAAWMSCERRGPWTRNDLDERAKELRSSEKSIRNAYRKPYMGEPCGYIADTYAAAAAVFEAALAALPPSGAGEKTS